VTILRDSIRGIHARFYLVGVYALATLLLNIMGDVASRLQQDDLAGDLGLVAAFVLFLLVYCGVRGLIYLAAAGRSGDGVGFRLSLALLLPFAWVGLKVMFLVVPPYVAAWSAYTSFHGPSPASTGQPDLEFHRWALPILELLARIFALYALPLAVVWWERGTPRAQIRQGLRLYRQFPGESLRLVLLLILTGSVEGALWFTRAMDSRAATLDLPFGVALFASCYLQLVCFYGASRVVVARLDAERPLDGPGADHAERRNPGATA